ncbi:MAG: type IV secretion system protein [Janthinobacterium lividum]
MKKDFLKFLAIIAVFVLIGCLLFAIIGAIGAMKLSNGCLMRYSSTDSNGYNTDQITKTILLKANANYTGISSTAADGSVSLSLDPNHYGEWVNTGLSVNTNQVSTKASDLDSTQIINITVKGKISLCGAYIPKNNFLQPSLSASLELENNTSDLDINNERILIPRVEDSNSNPLTIWLDATIDTWRNLTEVYPNDELIVALYRDRKPINDSNGTIIVNPQNVSYQNVFTEKIVSADCNEGQNTYSPICGRFSIYRGTYICNCRNDNGTWSNIYCPAPNNYLYNGRFTYSGSPDMSDSDLKLNFNSCVASDGTSKSEYADMIMDTSRTIPFWFSADLATGLLYRFDSSEEPTNANSQGTNYNYASIQGNQSTYNNNLDYQIIYESTYDANSPPAYLQYRLHDVDGDYGDNTGGYVLNIKQTKCVRSNGLLFSDTFQSRGAVDYIIVPGGQDPNSTDNSYDINTVTTSLEGSASITITTNQSAGNIWMKIRNNQDDYQDSKGQYTVTLVTYQPMNKFVIQVLNPLFETLKGKVSAASETIFKNMTCYNTTYSNCSNFFNYIKAMLTIYIILYAAMFLLGIVQITQQDLVIRVVKIAIVAGLMNQQTFEFFNIYIFNFVTNFSDQIISDIPGYNTFLSDGQVSNPFSFLDSLMTKIFFSQTFMAQLLALLSMGISGMLYFVIVLIALMIVVITVLRAITIYLMAFMAIALLIGLAPLFLTFVLFDYTRYLFDNWVKFTFRYMIEPTILLAGVIILTQLFTIYLDFVIGYSVCWKCALPIKIPFPSIPGLNTSFINSELFCISWFAPWGFDFRSGMMGINMQHMIALVIISYCIYGYTDLSGKIVTKLTGGIGANSSATQIGTSMSSAIEQSALHSVGLDKRSRDKIMKDIGQHAKQKIGDQLTKSRNKEDAGPSKPSSSNPKGSSSAKIGNYKKESESSNPKKME